MKKKSDHRRITFVFGTLLLTLMFSSAAMAQKEGTPGISYQGTWLLRQSNGFVVTMKLDVTSRGVIRGTATAKARNGVSTGTVTGRAWRIYGYSAQQNVDHFLVEIAWNGPVGVYQANATFDEGILRGQTYQKDKPSSKASWTAGPFARLR